MWYVCLKIGLATPTGPHIHLSSSFFTFAFPSISTQDRLVSWVPDLMLWMLDTAQKRWHQIFEQGIGASQPDPRKCVQSVMQNATRSTGLFVGLGRAGFVNPVYWHLLHQPQSGYAQSSIQGLCASNVPSLSLPQLPTCNMGINNTDYPLWHKDSCKNVVLATVKWFLQGIKAFSYRTSLPKHLEIKVFPDVQKRWDGNINRQQPLCEGTVVNEGSLKDLCVGSSPWSPRSSRIHHKRF